MDRIKEALFKIKRSWFLPEQEKIYADEDRPLPIGYSQTNSQPSTVKMMINWLSPQPGEKILDVGAGTGWTTALLSYLVEPAGSVYATEKIPQLLQLAEINCQKASCKNTQFFLAGNQYGLKQHAPFDKILVNAAAQKLPIDLVNQLTIGGRMVIPVNSDILVINKISDTEYKTENHGGFVFVPLV